MTDHTTPATTHAALLTTDPLLACDLLTRFTGLRVGLLTRLPGTSQGHLRDTDALLAIPAARNGGRTHTIYIGTDLDDHSVWRRAVQLRADAVVVLPDDDGEDQLCRWLTGQPDPTAITEPDDSSGDPAPP